MKKHTDLTLAIITYGATLIAALAAEWPTPPPGMAYETDLKPHSLVVTNVAAAGAAKMVANFISPTNQVFAAAVKAVEMDVDTSLLAQLADYAGVDLPAAGATATGVLMAVIFAALSALKTNKADTKDVPFKLVKKTQDQQLDDRAYNHMIGDVVATEGKWSAETETWDGEKETNPIIPDSIGVVNSFVEDYYAWILQWKPGAEDINDVDELPLTLLDESGTPKDLGSPYNIPSGRMKLQLFEGDYHGQGISLPAEAKFIVENVGMWALHKTYANATVSFVDSSGEQITLEADYVNTDTTVTGPGLDDFIFELRGDHWESGYTFYKYADSNEGDDFVDVRVGTPISVSVYDNTSDEEFSGTLILHDNGTIYGASGEMGGTVFAPLGLPDKNGEHVGVFSCSDIVGIFEASLHGEDPEMDELFLMGLDFYVSVGPFVLGETTTAFFRADSEALRGLISDDPPSTGTEITLRKMFFDDWMSESPDVSAYVSYAPGAITLIPPKPEGENVSRQFGVVLDGPANGSVKFQGAETIADVSINSEASRTVLRVTEPIRNAFVVVKEAEKVEVSDAEETV